MRGLWQHTEVKPSGSHSAFIPKCSIKEKPLQAWVLGIKFELTQQQHWHLISHFLNTFLTSFTFSHIRRHKNTRLWHWNITGNEPEGWRWNRDIAKKGINLTWFKGAMCKTFRLKYPENNIDTNKCEETVVLTLILITVLLYQKHLQSGLWTRIFGNWSVLNRTVF